jgi:uncharacterized protein (TIRG00374 family)
MIPFHTKPEHDSGSQHMKKSAIKAWINWKLIGILLFIVVVFSIDTAQLIKILRRANWTYVGLALLLQLLTLFMKSIRWRNILSTMGFTISLWKSFFLYVVSGYMGVVTPGRFGEFWKALRIKQEEKVPLVRGVFATLLDRAIDLYLYIWVGMICAASVGFMRQIPFIVQFVVLCLCAFPILLVKKNTRRGLVHYFLPRGLFLKVGVNIEDGLHEIEDSLQKVNSPRFIIPVSITVFAAGILFLQFWLILKSLGLDLHFLLAATIMSLLKFIGTIPITVFGLGTRDVALIFVFQVLGLSSSMAVGSSVLVFLVNHLAVSLFGFFLLVTIRIPEGGKVI